MTQLMRRWSVSILWLLLWAVVLFLFIPRFWEIGGESWKQWAAARILRETGGFPVFSLGPLYVVHLQLYSWFDFPLAVRLEYFITHLFAHTSIYLMLRTYTKMIWAVSLSCAWIPLLSYVEPGGAVAGMAFVALYLREQRRKKVVDFVPTFLVAAALCHSSFWLFAIGHVLGALGARLAGRCFCALEPSRDLVQFAAKAGLLSLVALVLLFPSKRDDRNHMLIDPTYLPIPVDNALVIGFFQIGTWKYADRNPNANVAGEYGEDWVYLHQKVWGHATSIYEAVNGSFEFVLINCFENLKLMATAGRFFLIGNFDSGILSFVFVLLGTSAFTLGFVGLIADLWKSQRLEVIAALALGALGLFVALMLTHPNQRYMMTTLPFWLLGTAHIARGLAILVNVALRLSSTGSLLGRIIASMDRSRGFLQGGIMSVSILCLLAGEMHYYPQGKTAIASVAHVRSVVDGRPILAGTSDNNVVSIFEAHDEVLSLLQRLDFVLAFELATWVLAFSDVGLENVRQIWGIPPYPDPDQRLALYGLDAILVDEYWTSSTSNARFACHIQPFLAEAVQNGWKREDISRFGQVYYKD